MVLPQYYHRIANLRPAVILHRRDQFPNNVAYYPIVILKAIAIALVYIARISIAIIVRS
jgi:hypothetical protein